MIRQRGFTLIQVMMTIALMGVISMMASPLSGAIVNDARLTETEGSLHKAVGKAKAIALRNASGVTGNQVAVVVCLSASNELSVLKSLDGTPANCSTMAGQRVWSVQLDDQVTIQTDEAGTYTDFSCMCLSNKGLLAGSVCSAVSCATTSVFQLAAGGSSEVISIY